MPATWRRLLRATVTASSRWTVHLALLVAAVLATIVLVFAIQARVRLADLDPWHTIELEEEFRVGRPGAPKTFDEYRQLEDRLFAELRRRVVDDPAVADRWAIGRYNPRSVPAQLALERPYNRSYELAPEDPRGAVLLVHGLSDAPYSLRAVAEIFRDRGFYVLVLRLPGHGTIPSGLVHTDWEDWYAAVSLAARHAAARVGPGKPFYAGGYSTGGALVTLYTLRGLEDPSLARPAHLFLFSPAIGVSRFAALSNIAGSLSFIPYFEKARWLDVLPEYDPYKYNSFPVSAGNQAFLLTREVHHAIDEAQARGTLARMPPVLAFQSLIDATVTAADLVGRLFLKLPPNGHELVVFGVNRYEAFNELIAPGPREAFDAIVTAPALPFRLTLVTNASGDTTEVAAFAREAGSRETRAVSLGLAWPPEIVSLGHVAIPFPPDDPVYGLRPRTDVPPRYALGERAARGEAGALVVPLGALARLRSNPFFEVIPRRIDAHLREGASP